MRWVVDPIDGTVNYLYGLPQWAVSIGVEVDGAGRWSASSSTRRKDELWTAVRGGGASLDGRPLRCSARAATCRRRWSATGFSYDARRRSVQARAPRRASCRSCATCGGSAPASLDLCSVAAGRVDAYYEQGLHPWDMSAGLLIAAEAGARTGDLRGGPAGYAHGRRRRRRRSSTRCVEVLVGLDADDDPLA